MYGIWVDENKNAGFLREFVFYYAKQDKYFMIAPEEHKKFLCEIKNDRE